MFHLITIVGVVALFSQASGTLELIKGTKETISFDGEFLEMAVDNTRGGRGQLKMCVGTTSDTSVEDCPRGFGVFELNFAPGDKISSLKLNRQGKIFFLGAKPSAAVNSIRFNDDNALDVILAVVPDPLTVVTLLNAKRYVPPEATETSTSKQSNTASLTVVVIALLVISGVLVAGLIVLICYCRRKTPPKMEQSNDRDQKHKTRKSSKADLAPLPPRAKSRRTSSTTVTTTTLPVKPAPPVAGLPVANTQSKFLMTTANPTLSPDTRPISSPFNNNPLNNSTNNSVSFKKVSGRCSKAL